MTLADAVATARRRTLTGKFWHQGSTRHPLVSCLDPAAGPGRYHRTGEPGVWYASNREQGAWAELFRHFVDEGIDPFEIRRRVGRASVELRYSISPTSRPVPISMWTKQTLWRRTMPSPRPLRLPPAMLALTPYWPRQPRYPVVRRWQCSFTRCPTSMPSDQKSANLLRGSLTSLR